MDTISREEAREMMEAIASLTRAQFITTSAAALEDESAMEKAAAYLASAEDRVSKILDKLSQPQSLGWPKE